MRPQVVLGKYELVEHIATGGMATLHRARFRGPGGVRKTVVIKRIRREHADDPRFIEMFLDEARLGVQLTHPNIILTHELARTGGQWFLAMEYVHGRDLQRITRRCRGSGDPIPTPRAVWLVAELCRGLHHAHRRELDLHGERLVGVVHRDVSPHNVLVGVDGQVKLTDFGVAVSSAQSMAGAGCAGKPIWRAPEVGQVGADHRVDVYGAGRLLVELLSDEGADGQLRQRPVDERLHEIVRSATDPDPASRPSTAAVLEEDLRAWLFANGSRVRATEVGQWVADLFPELTEVDTAPRVESLARDLAALQAGGGQTEPAFRTPRPSLDERKQVAVLVIDVDGLTALSAELEPEAFARRRFRLLRWVRSVVDGWSGVLQRAVDDQLTVLFGMPRTREDDLQRAMDCALDLLKRKGELVPRGLSMELCVGLHTGEVTVATRARRIATVARGDTTRLARRLSGMADHGELLVSPRVMAQIGSDYRLRQGPTLPGRGGAAGIPSYQVEGRRSGLRVARRGPWLRRGDEIQGLVDALGSLDRGQGRAVALVGPVGSGKSRLLAEVRRLSVARDIPFVLAEYGRFGTSHPFRALVARLLDVDVDAGSAGAVVVRAVASGLSQRQAMLLGWFFGQRTASPDRGEAAAALVALIRAVSSEFPTILALECEGMDEADGAALAGVVAQTRTRNVLWLLAIRPPLHAPLTGIVEVVPLFAFDRDAMDQMVASLLGVDAVAPALSERVAATCEGNGLYVEEMCKFLAHRGQLQIQDGRADLAPGPIELPDSLHGLIAARIDDLDAAAKGVIQLASVFGLRFDARLLGRAAGLDEIDGLLMDLASRGLLSNSEDGWAFRTPLVHEVAKRGTLGVQRRACHKLAAEAIEAFGDPVGQASRVARHHAKAGQSLAAARWSRVAGEQAEREGRLAEARQHYVTGLKWVASGRAPKEHEARVQGEASLNLDAGRVSLLLGDPRGATRYLTMALDIASELNLPWIASRTHLSLGRAYIHAGSLSLAAAHLEAASCAGAEREVELEALEARAGLAFECREFDEAERIWREVRERADDERLVARCESGLATLHLEIGNVDSARELLTEALGRARNVGDRILEGRALNNLGMGCSMVGDHDGALFHYRAALDARENTGYSRGSVISHHNIGDAHFQRGAWAHAHVAFARSRELATLAGWARGEVINDLFLHLLDSRMGSAVEETVAALERTAERADSIGAGASAVLARGLIGRVWIECGAVERGVQRMRECLQLADSEHLVTTAAQLRRLLP